MMYRDGSAGIVGGSVTSLHVNLTTTQPDDIIVAVVFDQLDLLTGVTGSGGTSGFAKLASETVAGGGSATVHIYYARASGALTSETITANASGAQNMSLIVFGVSGSPNFATWLWDTGIAVVPVNSGTSAAPSSSALSTVQSDDMVIAVAAAGGTETVTIPAGFTRVTSDVGPPTLSVSEQVVSGTVSGATYDWGLNTSANWATVVVAIAGSTISVPPIGATGQATASSTDTITVTLGPVDEGSAIFVALAFAGDIGPIFLHGDLGPNAGTATDDAGGLTWFLMVAGGTSSAGVVNKGCLTFVGWNPAKSAIYAPAGTYNITIKLEGTVDGIAAYAFEVKSNVGTLGLGLMPEYVGDYVFDLTGTATGDTSLSKGSPTWDQQLRITMVDVPVLGGTITATQGTLQAVVAEPTGKTRVVVAYGYMGPQGSPSANYCSIAWPTSVSYNGTNTTFGFAPALPAPSLPGSTVTVDQVDNLDQVQYVDKVSGYDQPPFSQNGYCAFGRPTQSFAIASVPSYTKLMLFLAYAPGPLGQFDVNLGDYYVDSVTDTLGTSFTRLGIFGSQDASPPQARVELWAGDVATGGDDFVLLSFFNGQAVAPAMLVPVVLTKDSSITAGDVVGGGGTTGTNPTVSLPSVSSGELMLAFFGLVTDDYSGKRVKVSGTETELLSSAGGIDAYGTGGCTCFPGVLLAQLPSSGPAHATWDAPGATNTYWAGLALPIDPAIPPVSAKEFGILGLNSVSPVIGLDNARTNKGKITHIGLPG